MKYKLKKHSTGVVSLSGGFIDIKSGDSEKVKTMEVEIKSEKELEGLKVDKKGKIKIGKKDFNL